QLRNVGGAFDARVLPGGRLLLAEYNLRRVTERDLQGNVLWEHVLRHSPLQAQRLPRGNTLVATNYQATEGNRSGKVVFSWADKGGDVFSAQRLPGGLTLVGLYSGVLLWLDRQGKEVRRVEIEPSRRGLVSIEVLPSGRLLIPLPSSNRVAEYDL